MGTLLAFSLGLRRCSSQFPVVEARECVHAIIAINLHLAASVGSEKTNVHLTGEQ